jgi:hypothetical protein
MEILTIAAFFAGGTGAAIAVTQFIKGIFDKLITPRFEPLVTQMILLVLCFVISGAGIAWHYLPDYVTAFMSAMFATGIATYEVLNAIIVGKKDNG